jgi:hypothetical protein
MENQQFQFMNPKEIKSDTFLAKQWMYLSKSEQLNKTHQAMWQSILWKTLVQIEHWEYIDLLSFRNKTPKKVDDKYEMTYFHVFLLGIYALIEEIVWPWVLQENMVRNVKQRLQDHDKELDRIMRIAYHEETFLFFAQESIWYDTASEIHRKRFINIFNDEPMIQIPLHTIRNTILPESYKVNRLITFELNDKFHLLFNTIKQNENELWISVSADIEKWSFIGLSIHKKTTEEEQNNPKLVKDKIFYGKIVENQMVGWNEVIYSYIQKTRFDKDPYLIIQ